MPPNIGKCDEKHGARSLYPPACPNVLSRTTSLYRFGVNEFQDLVRNDKLLAYHQQDAPACFTHDLESLKDDMLGLQIHTITWADAPAPVPLGTN